MMSGLLMKSVFVFTIKEKMKKEGGLLSQKTAPSRVKRKIFTYGVKKQ